MSRTPRAKQAPYGQPSQPQRKSDNSSLGGNSQSIEDAPIDDPNDAWRSSKSEPDGDGEEG